MTNGPSDEEYRMSMDCPMEDLAVALWGTGESLPRHANLKDHQIIEVAARKIELLRSMLLACGVNADMLKAIMDDA